MPAFGAYAGGLDVGEEAITALFRRRVSCVWLLGPGDRVYAVWLPQTGAAKDHRWKANRAGSP